MRWIVLVIISSLKEKAQRGRFEFLFCCGQQEYADFKLV